MPDAIDFPLREEDFDDGVLEAEFSTDAIARIVATAKEEARSAKAAETQLLGKVTRGRESHAGASKGELLELGKCHAALQMMGSVHPDDHDG